MKYFDEINKLDHVFLDKIEEHHKIGLLITIDVATVADYEEDTIVGKARPVIIEDNCPQYLIAFKGYVSYHVINESFRYDNDYDEFVGRIIRIYSKSTYLNLILEETIANYIFPDEMKHYGLFLENHLIHIISVSEPIITKRSQS